MELVDVDVNVDEKAEWSTQNDVIFIRILYDYRLPAVKPYRKKMLEHYEILGDIFNTTIVIGQLSFSSGQVPLPSSEDCEVEDNFINSRVHVNVDVESGHDDEEEEVDQTESSAKKKGKGPRRSIGSSNNCRKNK
ncbi:hypothetical protein Dsin_018560 [Dipteronia sinensis]|uniref:Uncharacterized protein n=1 Tax=Dipteronia sinensis TaxID=43782 RepID=A0AAE0A6C6_9ROSI|nr:hypothetical protein Dsin_018560 [Dipteronia sinensis]